MYRAAAEILSQCDYLLILAGAGMSADSGLQTYETMSEKYKEYCNPIKLIGVVDADADAAVATATTLGRVGDEDEKNKNELEQDDEQKEFQDFWYNFAVNYTNTKPHQGYDILNNWCHGKKLKRLNSNRNSKSNTTTTTTCDSKDIVEATSKKWWVYTSNVDGHFCQYPSFQRSSSSSSSSNSNNNNGNGNVCEIHGSASSFRCSCRIGYYNASATDYDYNYDDYDEKDQEQHQQLKPRMGEIWNRWNVRVNEVMTDRCHNNVIEVVHDDLGEEEEQQQQQLIRQCQECNTLPMRPNVLLFHDTDINILNSIQKQRIQYQQWEAIIEEELISNHNSNKSTNNNENQRNQNNSDNNNNNNNNNKSSKSTNFVLIEIGCGKNVPAVRNESEEILKDCMDKLALARTASATELNLLLD
ncbi:hypothetical protein FRACYDRAFT_233324 [Fragilariopsis cylindrus CCMP1102]|uniref:Uncharacterized protein n=1 Tax=Fragilariopsis cylindrus CCMP1102 TaxID=635003 RepID=A0A1E7FYD8_9STRA|nr:hypothetical protein FRACYDRAFT_233324 [Fragilariopsis cylindrus CCMP1102]|eukprot:OEU23155.1 hypothetical protein FRACYDRAFT_233324 [Fragilariopsis cylindrus CCMP1102]